MGASELVLFALNGLTEASHMFAMAAGLSVIFGVLGVLNFAHGALAMLGGYIAFSLAQRWGSFWLALAVAPLVVAAAGALVEWLLLRPLYRRPPVYQLLLTFGLVLVLMDAAKIFWGSGFRTVPVPPSLAVPVPVLGVWYPGYYLFSIAVAAVIGAGLWYFFARTGPGRLVRAAARDREMAAALGMNVRRLYTGVFALGSWLTGLGGVLMATIMPNTPATGIASVVPTFAIVVIGGLGSVPGAALGAVLVGELNAFGILLVPQLEMALMFALMALVLLARPRGLMGREER